MPKMITVPPVGLSDYGKAEVATEEAFNELIAAAERVGLPVPTPPAKLMYLPTEELTRNFQLACRAILDSLQAK